MKISIITPSLIINFKKQLSILIYLIAFSSLIHAQTINKSNTDIYQTSKGELSVSLLGHSSLILKFNQQIIHVDPYSSVADYSKLPKADLIILTHEHRDHLDQKAIALITKPETKFIMNSTCYEILKYGQVLKNNQKTKFNDVAILAIPAYNIVHKNPEGKAYHPKNIGNGYVFNFANLCLYVASDTENIDEMKELSNIDIAFLPMNLPYTMTPEMLADAALGFKPKILYPYHYGNKESLKKLESLLINSKIKMIIKNDSVNMVKGI